MNEDEILEKATEQIMALSKYGAFEKEIIKLIVKNALLEYALILVKGIKND